MECSCEKRYLAVGLAQTSILCRVNFDSSCVRFDALGHSLEIPKLKIWDGIAMKTVVRPLHFEVVAGAMLPRDSELFELALDFCRRQLQGEISFADYRDVLVVYKEDNRGNVSAVTGIACGALRYDVPVLRFLDAKSGKKLMERINDRLEDAGLEPGTELFVFVDEKEAEEQRCPAQRDWIEHWRAEPSKRLSVRLK